MDTPGDTTIESNGQPSLRRRLLWAGVLLALLVILILAARPAARRVKNWHARRLAAQAENALLQNDLRHAQEQVSAALILSRFEPSVLRTAARVEAQATNMAALQFWQALEQGGYLNSTDRQEIVVFALRTGVIKVAADGVNRLLADAPNAPTNLWLASQLFAAVGDRSNTLVYAYRAVAADPGNRRYQLFLWSVRCGDPDPDNRAKARGVLLELASGTDEIGWLALSFLAAEPGTTETELQKLAALAASRPRAEEDTGLVQLEINLRLKPDQRGRFLDELVAHNRTAAPEKRRAISVWLVQHGESLRALELLPVEEARHNRDLFLVCVDALASVRQWDKLQEILAGYTPLEPVYVEAFQARCAQQLSQPDVANIHWEASFNATHQNPDQLPWLANYAMLNGAAPTAKKALRDLARTSGDKRPIYDALLRVTDQSGDTEELQGLVGEMAQRWPEDAALRNDYAYLTLLLNQDIAAQRQTAEALLAKTPDFLASRTTLALALYRQKDFAAALKVYAGMKYDWTLASPFQQAIYAAVLASAGETNQARTLGRRIYLQLLRPEERALLKSVL